jgi:2-deoxy-D-gluconate 3-dehydrogenase
MMLSGQSALVTGAARGIGRAIAERYVREGARVVIGDINEDAATAAAREIGEGAMALHLDVTRQESIDAAIAGTVAAFGRLDILVNNAGTNIRNRPEVYKPEDWHTVLATNLTSTMLASQAAYPHLKAHGAGRVINNGSMLSIFGLPFHAAYGASKGGVVQLTRSLAVAWAADGITVNVVLPGWIDTDLTRKARKDMPTLNDNVLSRTPKGRWGEIKDFEGIAAFLGSDASAFVTGVAIPVDGGFSIQG